MVQKAGLEPSGLMFETLVLEIQDCISWELWTNLNPGFCHLLLLNGHLLSAIQWPDHDDCWPRGLSLFNVPFLFGARVLSKIRLMRGWVFGVQYVENEPGEYHLYLRQWHLVIGRAPWGGACTQFGLGFRIFWVDDLVSEKKRLCSTLGGHFQAGRTAL